MRSSASSAAETASRSKPTGMATSKVVAIARRDTRMRENSSGASGSSARRKSSSIAKQPRDKGGEDAIRTETRIQFSLLSSSYLFCVSRAAKEDELDLVHL